MNYRNLVIAIVANSSWNIFNFRLGLIDELLNRGYNVKVFAPADDKTKIIKSKYVDFHEIVSLQRKGTSPLRDLKLLNELRKIYISEQVHVVIHFTIKPVIYGSLAAKICGVKSINVITGLGYSFLSSGFVNFIVKKLYKFALKDADLTLFQNDDDRKLFLQGKMVSHNSTDIIYGSGIDTNFFSTESVTSASNIFLFIGRLLYDKGVRELFTAAKLVKHSYPNVKIQILGAIDKNNPSSVNDLELDIMVKSGIVEYLGTADDVRPYVEKALALVLPSYREGLPRVMLEGMSMKRILITTDVPGCKETVINGVNGFLVPVKNGKALSEAMIRVLKLSETEKIYMGEQGRRLALSRFDEKIVVKKYLEAVDSVILK